MFRPGALIVWARHHCWFVEIGDSGSLVLVFFFFTDAFASSWFGRFDMASNGDEEFGL